MKNNSSFTDKNCDGKFMSVISNENNDGIKKNSIDIADMSNY